MPPCHYVAKSAEARYEHRKFFATGVDIDHGGIEQIGEARGDVSLHLPYGFVRVLCRSETDRKNT